MRYLGFDSKSFMKRKIIIKKRKTSLAWVDNLNLNEVNGVVPILFSLFLNMLKPFHNKMVFKKKNLLVPMAQTCNPSYLGGRDWEAHSSRPAQGNSSWPYLQNNQTKMDWKYGSSSRAPALQVQSLEFKSSSTKKKKKRKRILLKMLN
jgi:hypothetical protein